jgi:hypothetical protein
LLECHHYQLYTYNSDLILHCFDALLKRDYHHQLYSYDYSTFLAHFHPLLQRHYHHLHYYYCNILYSFDAQFGVSEYSNWTGRHSVPVRL